MDGRCATVFAAAAAIGASFYVFLAPDGKKKKIAPRRGKSLVFIKDKHFPKITSLFHLFHFENEIRNSFISALIRLNENAKVL